MLELHNSTFAQSGTFQHERQLSMSRLYPGWGSGSKPYECELIVNSVACIGREDIEAGDKVILPQSAFRDISRLRLPFPLVFKVDNPRLKRSTQGKTNESLRPGKRSLSTVSGSAKPVHNGKNIPRNKVRNPKPPPTKAQQYCGLMEFSAPEKTAYFPFWMMKTLKLKEGSKVKLCSIFGKDLPKGISCKLQPHTGALLDVAASMDLRVLLEESFRNYSVLTKGTTIVVSIAGQNYDVNVVETTPSESISLYGNLDLEVDFAPPLDSSMGKIRPNKKTTRDGEAPLEINKENVSNQTVGQPQTPSTAIAPQPKQDETSDSPNKNSHAFPQEKVGGANIEATAPAHAFPQEKVGGANIEATAPAHSWGEGRVLSSSSTPSAENLKMPERKPSKYSTRRVASSFVGDGRALASTSENNEGGYGNGGLSTAETTEVAPNTLGRVLSSDTCNGQKSESLEDVRSRRLAFFERLERQQKNDMS